MSRTAAIAVVLSLSGLALGIVSAQSHPAPPEASARTAAPAPPSPLLPEPSPAITIPFQVAVRHIVLNIAVNGSRPLSFFLDTGAKQAIIDIERARELGLSLSGEVGVGGAGAGKGTGAWVKDASFTIVGFPGFKQPLSLAIPIRRMSARIGRDFDGILGTDFISGFVVEVDYQAKVLRLHDKDRFSYSGPGRSIPLELNPRGHPIIDAEITPIGRASIKIKALVDLGSGGALVLHSPFVKEQRLPGPAVKTVRSIGHGGAGGNVTGRVGRVVELRIGTYSISNPHVLFSEDEAGAFAEASIQGNIGQQIMSRFKIFLDYGHNRMILQPVPGLSGAFDRLDTGLVLEAEDRNYKSFRIREVLENSPGSEAGLKAGDVLAAIDGRAASSLTLEDILETFKRPGSYRLSVRRGDQTIEVTLTPRSLV